MAKRESNPKRWARLCSEGQQAFETLKSLFEDAEEGREEFDRTEASEDKEWTPTEKQEEAWAAAMAKAEDCCNELEEMRSEYGERYDNMNEGLQQSAYGEKCGAMNDVSFDFPSIDDFEDPDEIEALFTEAEGMEIPLGFGRD